MDEDTRSELVIIFMENKDKARIKKEELRVKLEELRNEYTRIENEFRNLDTLTAQQISDNSTSIVS